VYLDDRCPGPGHDGGALRGAPVSAVTLFESASLRVIGVQCAPPCASAGGARILLDSQAAGRNHRVWLFRHADRCPGRHPRAAEAACLPRLTDRCAEPVRSRHVARAKAFLVANFDQPLTLADIARATRCSSFHLARLFRSELGTSLRRYQERLRLAAAIERLAAGEADLLRLALDLGFTSHSHFTATFRRALGVTPSDLRRRLNQHHDARWARTILTAS
jgi:AraC-like DNA-binding protein